jgi:hypothetical protein
MLRLGECEPPIGQICFVVAKHPGKRFPCSLYERDDPRAVPASRSERHPTPPAQVGELENDG